MLISTFVQLCFLFLAGLLGYWHDSAWWLIPLTITMAVFSWLTDRHWKIRFYDIYSPRDWLKFWLETLFGMVCFIFAAFVAGRLLRRIIELYNAVQ
jgi:biotin transporter BioY